MVIIMGKVRIEVYNENKYVNGHNHTTNGAKCYIEQWLNKNEDIDEIRIIKL